jgi:hypothetical protein
MPIYTVFVRKTTKQYKGEANEATTSCTFRGASGYFVGCCVGDVTPENVEAFAHGEDPQVLLAELGVVLEGGDEE